MRFRFFFAHNIANILFVCYSLGYWINSIACHVVCISIHEHSLNTSISQWKLHWICAVFFFRLAAWPLVDVWVGGGGRGIVEGILWKLHLCERYNFHLNMRDKRVFEHLNIVPFLFTQFRNIAYNSLHDRVRYVNLWRLILILEYI